MFTIMRSTDDQVMVVTNNPKVAGAIREDDHRTGQVTPIFFTGAPDVETARSLAFGAHSLFDVPFRILRDRDQGNFYAHPETETFNTQDLVE